MKATVRGNNRLASKFYHLPCTSSWKLRFKQFCVLPKRQQKQRSRKSESHPTLVTIFVTFVFGCVVVEFRFWVTYFYYFEQWWLSSIIPQIFILLKSLHTVWYKCAVSRSQPCISRYYRPCGSFYIFATGGCYAGSLPLLGSRLSISHWRTRT